ncbi:glycoside hydrolase family 15 protein [Aeromicrobium sp. Leaf350]|uniref:glycoside hydrolase family 15 protein n=1 Tax=Aeromicrobium sp. Leaf350 TaxID=2876565 RepID=UPI001E58E6C2|nr:glycoside hydrolase family 15 protein [Aeromicrobium sp. Leaf350]
MTDDDSDVAAHGLIGDLRSAAMVAEDGTIDWFCPGRFDAPSVFASILDEERGGSWTIQPDETVRRTQQFYLPDSAVLATRFLTDAGVVEVNDFMPISCARDPHHRQRIVRRVQVVRGSATVRTRLAVRPDYARGSAELRPVEGGLMITDDTTRLGISATAELEIDGDDVVSHVELEQGETALYVLEVLPPDAELDPCEAPDTATLFETTSDFWRTWLAGSTYRGRWREAVNRSAITLKLLTHEPSGAIVAAATTSLPEEIGGERNWDYRYVWIRDAAFSLYALLSLGFTEEADAFMRWLSERLGEDADGDLGPLRVMYDIDGKPPAEEIELDHLRGYRDSTPVRVGNAAAGQLQLDIYGEIIDSVYLFDKHGPGISHDAWKDVARVVDWVAENWERPDAGMWEIRGDVREHTTSRLMCWVALERAIRIAHKRGLPGDLVTWSRVRDEIYDRIHADSWNGDTFTQTAGGTALDAGVLLMPLVKFTSPVDPRFLSTLEAIEERLVTDSLVLRYDSDESPDGVAGDEGTFTLCSFWYVEALTRAGRLRDAEIAFEKMQTYANHVGLYAEQIGATGEQLGNFPQAFTHLSMISAAINLDKALG